VHRFFRVAAIVLLEYVAAGAFLFGVLEALSPFKGPCQGAACAIDDYFQMEGLLLLGGLTVTGFIASLIVIAFRQRQWARTRNPASHETSLFGSATVATAFGWAWSLPASPLILWAANELSFFISN
jgi:hypothetical protein